MIFNQIITMGIELILADDISIRVMVIELALATIVENEIERSAIIVPLAEFIITEHHRADMP